MSDGSQSDSEAEIVDLTSEDDLPESIQDDGTPPPIEIVMMVDGHGEAVNHTVEGPDSIDSMDSGESDVSDDEIEDNDPVDSDPDDDDDDDEIEGNDPVDNVLNDSDPGDAGGDSDDDGGLEDDEPDDDAWSDAGTETDTDDDPINNDDVEGDVMHGHKNENATIAQCLEEEGIRIPEWNGNCTETCQPGWNNLTRGFQSYRNRFLQKRNQLATCKARNRYRLTQKNRFIRPFKEAVKDFYRATRVNIDVNRALHEEDAALRRLVREEDLENFPEPVDLPIDDMWAALPQALRNELPPGYRQRVRRLRESQQPGARPRKTEREWPQKYRGWLQHQYQPGISDWGGIYKLSCKEENMSWAFNQTQRPKTHPDLRLRPPTDVEEARGILERACTPKFDSEDSSSNDEGETQPFRFQALSRKVQLKILCYALVFHGDAVHAISRLDPYYELDSLHRNCNGRTALLHRFHIGKERVSLTFGAIHPQWLLAPLLILQHVELLWMGSQNLTWEVDSRGKYTSRRTHDLAGLPEARRLKTISIHIPESSRACMRRKHGPRDMIRYLGRKTKEQPNYRLFRALRTVQGLDYLSCLRGLHGVTFWDYDKWCATEEKVPVRDWTFIQDVNNAVRRDKLPRDELLSRIRYLAPIMVGCRPSVALAARLERFINPPTTGLLSPPPDLFPQLQTAVRDADDGSGDEAIDDEDSDTSSEHDSDGSGSDSDDDLGDDPDSYSHPGPDMGLDTDSDADGSNMDPIDLTNDDENEDDDMIEIPNPEAAERAVMLPPEVPIREPPSDGQGGESSLFKTPTPDESPQPPFEFKKETPPESTPERHRSESSLWVGGPPSVQQSPDPREGGMDSPIDITQDNDLQRQKRRLSSVNDDDDEVSCTGSSPKRARTDDGNSDGTGTVPRGPTVPFLIEDEDDDE
ncbi:unnamed protein product [Fusarium equiseti]|uniref:Uncharacterized protein n=1 Tax=Fusarium equiseti TaxID=61235 RepID=A0A8J2IT19_FUSEQ|nr:unnamed protein product [Fusarium equiseti]